MLGMKTKDTTNELELLKQRIAELENEVAQSQAALRKTEQKYHELFENAGDAIFVVDANTFRILDANKSAARRLGYTLEELLRLTMDDIEVFDGATGLLKRVFWETSTGGTSFYESQYRRKDGTFAAVEVSSRGVILDGVSVIQNHVRDISSRKEAEYARRQAESEALRLVTVIEQAAETIIITELDGTIVYANPYFEETTGYTVAEMLGQNTRLLKSGAQDGNFYRNLWSTISSGSIWRGTFTNRRKNGEAYYEDATIFPLRDLDGNITHYASVKRDITEHVKAEQERDLALSEMDAFAHTVAHDLKSPLSILTGYSNLLVDLYDSFNSEEIRNMLISMEQCSFKMVKIIDELLLLASTRSQHEFETEPLTMQEVIAEALIPLRLSIEESQAKVVLVSPETWPKAVGHAAWVEEIWSNYISNAIKYGGTPPHIELGAHQETESHVRFWVRDNGVGLTQEQQGQLFKPFTRISEIRAQGHGLGLSIVQRIVQRLGGTVDVQSRLGHGSVFSFTLPAAINA
jgi:PAS domain S-box-containing protein